MSAMDRGPERPPSEAHCVLCGETFFPSSPEDLMHFQRRDGELCGGEGLPVRDYIIRRRPRD